MGKFIVASGPVVVEDGKLLVTKDEKDDFYKVPGGRVKEGETFEATCIRRVKEEANADIEITNPLTPQILYKNLQTGEPMTIVLIHFKAKLKNKDELKAGEKIEEVKWLDVGEIKEGMHNVGPNIKFLIEKGDIV